MCAEQKLSDDVIPYAYFPWKSYYLKLIGTWNWALWIGLSRKLCDSNSREVFQQSIISSVDAIFSGVLSRWWNEYHMSRYTHLKRCQSISRFGFLILMNFLDLIWKMTRLFLMWNIAFFHHEIYFDSIIILDISMFSYYFERERISKNHTMLSNFVNKLFFADKLVTLVWTIKTNRK